MIINKKLKISFSILLNISILSIIIFCLTGCFESSTPIELYMPNLEDVENIYIGDTCIKEENEIEDIFNVLYCDGKGRTTKSESWHDYPPNAENVLRIYINTNNDKSGNGITIYAFMRTDWSSESYYLESPYNGSYDITEEEYNNLAKYAKDIE